MPSRRQFLAASAGLTGLLLAHDGGVPARAHQREHMCDGVQLGATRQDVHDTGCLEHINEADGYVNGQITFNGVKIAEQFVGYENDLVSYIETRLRGDENPDGLSLPDAMTRFTDRQVPGDLQLDVLYNQTLGLSTKTTGYAATVGHSAKLAETNGRSGYFLKLYSCVGGGYARQVPSADATLVSSTFAAIETAETFTITPTGGADGEPCLGADADAWIGAYGEGTEGENYTKVYADLPGSPNVFIAAQMRAAGIVSEVAAYGVDLDTASALAERMIPADATLESTFYLPPSPGASFSIRFQQWTSASLELPVMAMYIFQGKEGAADLDAVIIGMNGQMTGFTTG